MESSTYIAYIPVELALELKYVRCREYYHAGKTIR